MFIGKLSLYDLRKINKSIQEMDLFDVFRILCTSSLNGCDFHALELSIQSKFECETASRHSFFLAIAKGVEWEHKPMRN